MTPLYEDNHLIVVAKEPGEIVQGDKTGDRPLSETVKAYLKELHNKPGNVFCGVVHRLDRPVGGVVIFAKTSKALSRLNEMLRNGQIKKLYWALVEGRPANDEETLENYLVSNQKLNKTFIARPDSKDAKLARLHYRVLARGLCYSLLEIELLTGRKHQIRAQLAAIGHPIKGDLKYGSRRSNPDGSISLLARSVEFEHPVSHDNIKVEASPTPEMQKILEA